MIDPKAMNLIIDFLADGEDHRCGNAELYVRAVQFVDENGSREDKKKMRKRCPLFFAE